MLPVRVGYLVCEVLTFFIKLITKTNIMKYKLIKTYPGSPKLGTIVEKDDGGVYYIPDNDSELSFTELNHYPYAYPEFWQPVVEKDYEILSLVASEKNPQHKKGTKFLHNKDYKFKNMHPTEFWDIYSVKRISDNKIFTIGDFYEDLIIEKMFMSVAGDILTTYKPKIKQPLFTTEDGVDISESDKYYFVSIDYTEIFTPHLKSVYLEHYLSILKCFSTKEKAEEYILMNKPCLSINDVKPVLSYSSTNALNDLISTVKSKI